VVVLSFSSASQYVWEKGLPSGEGGWNALSCPQLWRAACFAIASADSFTTTSVKCV